jgi:tetratricopeptide (TPR) repeat protein
LGLANEEMIAMSQRDDWGNTASGGSAIAQDLYGRALRQFQCYQGDPLLPLDAALRDSPDLVMGHVLHAWLHLMGTEPAGLPVARNSLARAARLSANSREQAHIAAIGQLLDGQWQLAARTLEDLNIAHPRDPLALQVGHLMDFFLGQSRMLRDRIARALPHWSEALPGFHAILGMHAFGLEEMGHYGRAEQTGRRAIEIEPGDAWARHAVAHVMEMQGRTTQGIAWLRESADSWSKENGLAVHNWWHLALYHLELGQIEEVLALYDGPINGSDSTVVMELIDASAMLWRLQLRGVDVGQRWQSLADRWEASLDAGSFYAFNDMHAVLAFIGAGRGGAIERVLAAQEQSVASSIGDNVGFVVDVAAPMIQGLLAFDRGNAAQATRLLRGVRNHAWRFGGSHAQRDLIDLTLIEAANRAGQNGLVQALVSERLDLKPNSPLLPRWQGALGELAQADVAIAA